MDVKRNHMRPDEVKGALSKTNIKYTLRIDHNFYWEAAIGTSSSYMHFDTILEAAQYFYQTYPNSKLVIEEHIIP